MATVFLFCVFFFKQKTAYEMRISDWSSDVCSSDLVEGGQRARITKYGDTADFFQAYAEAVADDAGDDRELDALARTVVSQFEQYIKLNKKIPPAVDRKSTRLNSSH